MGLSPSGILVLAGAAPEFFRPTPEPATETLSITAGQIPALVVDFALRSDYADPDAVERSVRNGDYPLEKMGDALLQAIHPELDVAAPVQYLLSYAQHFAFGIQEPEVPGAVHTHLNTMRKLIREAQQEGVAHELAGPQPEMRAWVTSITEHVVSALAPVRESTKHSDPVARLLMLGLGFHTLCLDILQKPVLQEKSGENVDSNIQRACFEAIVRPLILEVARSLNWLPRNIEESRAWVEKLKASVIEEKKLKQVSDDLPERYTQGLRDVRYLRQFLISAIQSDEFRFSVPRLREALEQVVAPSKQPFVEAVLPSCPIFVCRAGPGESIGMLTTFDFATRSAIIVALGENGPETGSRIGADGTLFGGDFGTLMPEQPYSKELKPLAHALYRQSYRSLEEIWISYPEVYSALRGDKPVVMSGDGESEVELIIPKRIYEELKGRLPLRVLVDQDSEALATQWSERFEEAYVPCVLPKPTEAEEITAEPAIASPSLSDKDARAEIRRHFNRLGAPNYDEFVGSLRSFGIHQDPSAGKGSHSALFRETEDGVYRATMCGTTRVETEALKLGVVWDTLDCLRIPLNEYLRVIEGAKRL
jgi:hypothetical protein